jgi:ADP-ribose pyrophosphatase
MSTSKKSPTGVEIIERKTAYQGYFRIDRYVLRHEKFDGTWTKPIVREVFERGHAVAVLLYDPKLDLFVLCEQFRIGALAAKLPAWQIELVAGIIDEGETPEDVARRESIEEAGLAVQQLWPITHYCPSPGGTSETVHLYLGRVAAEGAGGTFGLATENEDIHVTTVTPEQLRALLDSGKIGNAATLLASQWFFLNRDKVRAAWA